MSESSPYQGSEPTGWSTDSQIVREFDRPVRVSEAVIETLIEAVEDWPELSRSPPVFEFVDTDNLDGLFKACTVEETSHLPSGVSLPRRTCDGHVRINGACHRRTRCVRESG